MRLLVCKPILCHKLKLVHKIFKKISISNVSKRKVRAREYAQAILDFVDNNLSQYLRGNIFEGKFAFSNDFFPDFL